MISNNVYIEEECKDSSTVYSHPPKCIIYNELHRANFDHYLLNPRDLKLIGFIKSNEDPNIFQICG